MKNIVLIGMPGAGKSTIGVLLAKTLLKDFVDTDLLIQKKYSLSLCDIIAQKGTEEFLKAENNAICEEKIQNCVVATGGSAVYGCEAMKKLKQNGIAVYLKVGVNELEKRIQNIRSRGIVMKDGESLTDIYKERTPLYEKYADITVDCELLSPEQCVEAIVESLHCE